MTTTDDQRAVLRGYTGKEFFEPRPLVAPTVFGTARMAKASKTSIYVDTLGLIVFAKEGAKTGGLLGWTGLFWALRAALEKSPAVRAFLREMLDEIEKTS